MKKQKESKGKSGRKAPRRFDYHTIDLEVQKVVMVEDKTVVESIEETMTLPSPVRKPPTRKPGRRHPRKCGKCVGCMASG